MKGRLLRVLLVFDGEGDAIVLRELARGGYELVSHRVKTELEMREALTKPWDVVLSDYSMTEFDALSALAVLKQTGSAIPFIIVAGTVGEEKAVEALTAGASDFLVKRKLARLLPALERELKEAEVRHRLRREQLEAEQSLREQSSMLRSIVESISDGIAVADRNGKILLCNAAHQRTVGISAEDELLQKWSSAFGVFLPDTSTPFPADELPLARAIRGEQTGTVEVFVRNRSLPEGVHLGVIGSPMLDERGDVHGGVVVIRDITERKRAEAALRASEERYRLMFDASPLPMWMYDCNTLAFLAVNEAAVRHYGYTREEFARFTLKDIRPPEDVPALLDDIARPSPEFQAKTWRHRKKDGSIILVEIKAHDFNLEGTRVRLVLANDVTAREKAQESLRKAEEQLRQAQKMEAVGRLAGGVAHDFNNVLSVILSYGELLLYDLKPSDPLRADLEEIQKAGKRAAELTRQLLTFSHQQVFELKVLDLNDVVGNLDAMLRRILGADIDLSLVQARPLGRIRGDRTNTEQVILNLVVNARDAMPTGGKLTIETANVVVDENIAREHLGLNEGPHVMLAVTDTGIGMDRATQARIFEPFFTTKEKTKGTGLGLSTVFGIVQQSQGSIWVYSEIGKGTTFKVYLPRVDAVIEQSRSLPPPVTLRGSETILMVEDDDQVRMVASSILNRYGYQVLEARNAGEAVILSEKHLQPIHLLLSDVVMPQLGGPELARRLLGTRPEMKVICMSGYTDDTIVRHGLIDSDVAYLQKPITPEALTRKVREVLDAVAS